MDIDETIGGAGAWRLPADDNEPTFDHPRRVDTTTSTGRTVSEWGESERADTCRICRSEGTADEPLFFPCKCSGSIKYVHQECLMEWLAHSHKKHCELCKTPFRFTKLYDADMPNVLPWSVFIQRACIHTLLAAVYVCRLLLVVIIWLIALPWFIRWTWRWMFWIADAGWAREAWMESAGINGTHQAGMLHNMTTASLSEPMMLIAARELAGSLGMTSVADSLRPSNNTGSVSTASFPNTDASLLSSWTYVSKLTSDARYNRIILDIFEGQLITCVVITGFVLVFLIREWVVQQQPIAHLENVEQQLREVADVVQAGHERLRLQQEIMDNTHNRLRTMMVTDMLADILAEGDIHETASRPVVEVPEVKQALDEAINELRGESDSARLRFLASAESAIDLIRSAAENVANKPMISAELNNIFLDLTDFELQQWQEAIRRKTISRSHRNEAAATADRVDARIAALRDLQAIEESVHIEDDARDILQSIAERADPSMYLPNESTNREQSIESPPSTSQQYALLENNDTTSVEVHDPVDPVLGVSVGPHSDIPITNAGPDAKVNVLCSSRARGRPIREPISRSSSRTGINNRVAEAEAAQPSTSRQHDVDSPPQHSDTASSWNLVDQNEGGSANDSGEQQAPLMQPVHNHINDENRTHHTQTNSNVDDDASDAESQQHQAVDKRPNYVQSLAEWFWADIEVESDSRVPTPTPEEERILRVDENNAPIVPEEVELRPEARDNENDGDDEHAHDPDVVAAAAQAGLDAEALDEVEDLEGILELIGLQGPIIGLVQTSAFCTVLVIATVAAAVNLPYVWGKLVLSFIGSPIYFLVKAPLQLASFVADTIVDVSLLLMSWMILILAEATGAKSATWPSILHCDKLFEWILNVASKVVHSSGNRLQSLLIPLEEMDTLTMNLPLLGASAHAHASLLTLKSDIAIVLQVLSKMIGACAEFASTSTDSTWRISATGALSLFRGIYAQILRTAAVSQGYLQRWISDMASLQSGALTFKTQTIPIDASLIYWSSTDRFLAVVVGYLALAALAAVYVTADTYLTRSPSGQKSEKIIRDSLRQAGGVLKVILIISIEMLVFPFYCGLLLDLAFLPIFEGASVATRWAFATSNPYMFCFVHWFFGTCYMFHFALFVGMCRKILRRGVLWFIRDPDDPTFHPVRDVLERSVTTQLRKIAFSALVYGALVILCLGGVIWAIDQALPQIFPIRWVSVEPIWEFPMDLLLYNAMTPIIIKFLKPSDAVHQLYTWWLRRSARQLRLSHFLFGERQKDEEKHYVQTGQASFLRTGHLERGAADFMIGSADAAHTENEPRTSPDGKFVLTPCSDQYRPPKRGEAILHADADEVFIVDRNGKRNEHFAAVYIPPLFRIRVTLFMMCLWAFSAFLGLCVTLLPLMSGRQMLALLLHGTTQVNDIYAYSLGIYFLGVSLFVALAIKHLYQRLHNFTATLRSGVGVKLQGFLAQSLPVLGRVLKCVYAYGFVGLVLPLMMAFIIQFYVILPLHTYAATVVAGERNLANASNTTVAQSSNNTTVAQPTSGFLHEINGQQIAIRHTIHMLQDYCLGVLCIRVLIRGVNDEPVAKVLEAFRRVTANGLTNPDVRLVTRYAVLPATAIASLALFCPIIFARVFLSTLGVVARSRAYLTSAEYQTLVYRYSYPTTAALLLLALSVLAIVKAVQRWRNQIRDEVYLVGERLHNLGEKKPPEGSKTILR